MEVFLTNILNAEDGYGQQFAMASQWPFSELHNENECQNKQFFVYWNLFKKYLLDYKNL